MPYFPQWQRLIGGDTTAGSSRRCLVGSSALWATEFSFSGTVLAIFMSL
jgi:hypothetical protein